MINCNVIFNYQVLKHHTNELATAKNTFAYLYIYFCFVCNVVDYHITRILNCKWPHIELTLSGCNVRPENRRAHRVSKLIVLCMAKRRSLTSISCTRLAIILESSFLQKKKEKICNNSQGKANHNSTHDS